MEEGVVDFSSWLRNWLSDFQTDVGVMEPYITSILQEGSDYDETVESLDGILVELASEKKPGVTTESLREEILSKWSMCNNAKTAPEVPGAKAGDDTLVDPFSQMLRLATDNVESATKRNAETDPKLREAILSNLAQQSDESDEDEDNKGPSSSAKKKGTQDADSALENAFGRNVNAEKVLNEQRDLKDKAKAESAKKRERDKEDRTKQKAAAQERKDKAKKKSAKVERKTR